MKILHKILIICLLCCFGSLISQAQVTVDSTATTTAADTLAAAAAAFGDGNSNDEQNDDPADTVGHIHYKLTADGIGSSGNVSRLLLQLGGGFDWNIHEIVKLYSSPAFAYGEQSHLLNEREYFADLRFAILHQHRFYYLAFGSYEKSNLRQILFRWIVAGGVGFKLLQKPHAKLTITNVLLHEKTDYELLNDVNLWRNSTRITGEYHFEKSKFSLAHTLYFQPAITQTNNLRMRGSLHLNYKISGTMSLRMVLDDSYESLVVPGRKTNDFAWTFGFAYEKG